MTKIKLLNNFCVSVFVLSTLTLPLVSCSKNNDDPDTPEEDDKFYDYINDRTFSLQYRVYEKTTNDGDAYFEFGTGWILGDATPDNDDDYVYNIATTFTFVYDMWHLRNKHPDYISENLSFADSSFTHRFDGIVDCRQYKIFSNVQDIERLSWENFYFDKLNPPPSDDFYQYFQPVVNFYVFQANFGDTLTSYPKVKEKLDRVNQFKKEHGYINKIVNGADPEIVKKTKYTLGYPVKPSTELPDPEVLGGYMQQIKIENMDDSMFYEVTLPILKIIVFMLLQVCLVEQILLNYQLFLNLL